MFNTLVEVIICQAEEQCGGFLDKSEDELNEQQEISDDKIVMTMNQYFLNVSMVQSVVLSALHGLFYVIC